MLQIINPPSTSASFPPVTTTAAFTVPDEQQVLIALPLDTDDYVYLDGFLVEMD